MRDFISVVVIIIQLQNRGFEKLNPTCTSHIISIFFYALCEVTDMFCRILWPLFIPKFVGTFAFMFRVVKTVALLFSLIYLKEVTVF